MIDKTTSRVIVGLLVTAGVMVAAFAWYKARDAASPDAGAYKNIYDVDVPQSAPIPVDYRLILLTPQELAKAPLADVFVSPLGDDNGAFTYSAQGFGAMNAARGGRHTGQDLNGIGGENTDEGLPVRAAGRGLLIYAGEPSPDWGNVVVLLHRLPDPVIALKDVQQAAGWEKLLENLYRDNSMEALDKILPKEQQEGALEPSP